MKIKQKHVTYSTKHKRSSAMIHNNSTDKVPSLILALVNQKNMLPPDVWNRVHLLILFLPRSPTLAKLLNKH